MMQKRNLNGSANLHNTVKSEKWLRKLLNIRSLVKLKKEVILLRFLLRMDEKIYQFMPQYAMIRQKIICHKNTWKWCKYSILRRFRALIKILFVCHGSILRSSGEACKINDFTVGYGAYYTTTTPFLERALKWQSLYINKNESIESKLL